MPDFCPNCGTEVIEDCECAVCDSDCISVDGNGRPFIFAPDLDPDPDNLATCGPDGLLAQLPSYVLSPPRCHVYNSANQSNPNNTDLVLAFNSERFDTDTMHDTVTENEKVVFTTAGIYIVIAQVEFETAATGDRKLAIYKNGTQPIGHVSRMIGSTTYNHGISVCIQESFEVGDFIIARTRQDSGGALNVLATRNSPILACLFRRPLPTS